MILVGVGVEVVEAKGIRGVGVCSWRGIGVVITR